MKGNKGEWSEIYTLLKILADKKLFAGDKDLNKVESLIFPIIKVLRDESNGTYSYSYEDDLVVIDGCEEIFKIPISVFAEHAIFLLSRLQETTSATFSIPEVEEFINSFSCTSLKAKSSVKSDIRIIIHDLHTGTTPLLGFSIKSQLGSASTLFNAGKSTNFIYKIEGVELSDSQIEEINEIIGASKIKSRITKLKEFSGDIKYQQTENPVFENNLTLIDSSLPEIMAELVKVFFTTTMSRTEDLVSVVTSSNPMGYNLATHHPFYSYKIKRLLTDIALGMMAAKVWTGKLDATGGYLVVKEDGEVLCYHIYNRNEFEDYLLRNTKLETASSSKHDFGKVYKVGDQCFFKLNLQIRFSK